MTDLAMADRLVDLIHYEKNEVLNLFDGAWPLMDGIVERFSSLSYRLMFPTMDSHSAEARRVVGKIRCNIASANEEGNGISLINFREVTAEEVRGQAKSIMPLMVRCHWGSMDPEGGKAQVSAASIFGFNGKGWASLSAGQYWRQAEMKEKLDAAFSLNFIKSLLWSVYLSVDGGVGISFPTDRDGARRAFRLREVPEGKSRRDAIRHWVREHMRTDWRDSTRSFKVGRHLRGVESFTWNGLHCRIRPSYWETKEPNEDWAHITEAIREHMAKWNRNHELAREAATR